MGAVVRQAWLPSPVGPLTAWTIPGKHLTLEAPQSLHLLTGDDHRVTVVIGHLVHTLHQTSDTFTGTAWIASSP